jgi:hypothetical protein
LPEKLLAFARTATGHGGTGAEIASAQCIDYGDFLHWEGSLATPDDALGIAADDQHAYVACAH